MCWWWWVLTFYYKMALLVWLNLFQMLVSGRDFERQTRFPLVTLVLQIQLDLLLFAALKWLNAVGSDTSWTRSEPAASIAKREASCASGILGESEVPNRGIPHQKLVLFFGGEVPQFGKPWFSKPTYIYMFLSACFTSYQPRKWHPVASIYIYILFYAEVSILCGDWALLKRNPQTPRPGVWFLTSAKCCFCFELESIFVNLRPAWEPQLQRHGFVSKRSMEDDKWW